MIKVVSNSSHELYRVARGEKQRSYKKQDHQEQHSNDKKSLYEPHAKRVTVSQTFVACM